MLPRASPKCKLTRPISPLCVKLTIFCIVILISSLAIVQFLLVINDTAIKLKNVESSDGKISRARKSSYSSIDREASMWPVPRLEDRLDNNGDNHEKSTLSNSSSSTTVASRTMRRRNDNFMPNQLVQIGTKLSEPSLKPKLSLADSIVSQDRFAPPILTINTIPSGRQENLAESASESMNGGTVMMAAASAAKESARPKGKSVRSPANHNGRSVNFRDEPEEPSQEQQANSDDEGEDAQIRGVDGFGTIRISKPNKIAGNRATTSSEHGQTGAAATRNLARKSSRDDLDLNDDDDDSRDESRTMTGQSRVGKPMAISPNADDTMMPSKIPESMDSLMNLGEQEEMSGYESTDPPPASSQTNGGTKALQTISLPNKLGAQRRVASKRYVENDEDDSDFDLDERSKQVGVMPGQEGPDEDLSVAAGHSYSKKKKHHGHGHDHGKYYMYAKVPKKKTWEFGFKKGNKKHWIERHEKGHKNKFKTKVKWYDKKSKGKGVHIWDYNHHDKKHHG